MSETVPKEGCPFTITVAPIKGSVVLSVTVPLTEIPFCANSVALNANSIRIVEMVCLISCFGFFDFDRF